MKRNNLLHLCLVALLFIGLTAGEALAQNFHNNNNGTDSLGVYNASCGAVIRIRSTAASDKFTGSAPLGTAGNSIKGTVEYAATSGTSQPVQAAYYEHLVLTGTVAKAVPDGVHITGTQCATFLTGYDNLNNWPFYTSGGDVTYAGTIYYDGTDPQNIFPTSTATGGTHYNILDLSGGVKTIRDAETVTVVSNVTASANVTVTGDLQLGAATSTFTGTVTLDNANAGIHAGAGTTDFNGDVTVTLGDIDIPDGSGDVTVGAGATLALADAAGGSTLHLGDGTGTPAELIITGAFTNAFAAATNMTFDCTSILTYNGTASQNIVATVTTNPFGSLNLIGSDAVALGDIWICQDFNFATSGAVANTLAMGTNTLHMLNAAGAVTYGDVEEVVGAFERNILYASQPAEGYRFNNMHTKATFTDGVNVPTSMTFNVQPGLPPTGFDSTTDVKRKVVLSYVSNAGGDFSDNLTLTVGYRDDEDNGWPADALHTWQRVRMYEDQAGTLEKMGTGNPYTNGGPAAADTLAYAELSGISEITGNVPNGNGNFASGHEILLRTGPIEFISKTAGRWTNPNTWDEGSVPTEDDNAFVRHVVYAGITAAPSGAFETPVSGNTTPEATHYTPVSGEIYIANMITIQNDPNPADQTDGYHHPALIIGNEDNGNNVLMTKQETGFTLINDNHAASVAAIGATPLPKSTAQADLNGLWITSIITGSNLVQFGTQNYQNAGTFNNEGILILGQ
jgi:hypothetical protein